MASAYLSGKSWIVDFRGLHVKKQRRVRIPMAEIPGIDSKTNRARAQAFADDCERCVRVLETAPIGELITRAEQLGAITADQAAALRGSPLAAGGTAEPRPCEIVEVAKAHPSSRAESVAVAKRHRDLLQRFCTWARIERIDQITLDLVQRWIEHLVAEGYAWDTRRHSMLWLRRACQMGIRQGIPDPLDGFRLDRRQSGQRGKIVALTRAELVAMLAVLAKATRRNPADYTLPPIPDPRPWLATVLGGCLGLRPSETYRVMPEDLDLDRQVLKTGTKNDASVRDLPLPLLLCRELAKFLRDCPPGKPIFRTLSPRGSRPFNETTWSQWLGPLLRTAAGRPDLMAKSLRKTFSTWTARDRWPAIELEAFLGHESSQVSAVTARSYLADYQVEELRPAASRINQLLLDSQVQTKTSASP